jgi:NNP family nitrate/nitrite transporter-like MFS transporter
LVLCGFFIGTALASFSVGVGFVSGWYAPERQGMALGVYGAGNIGQSLAAFGSPLIAGRLGSSGILDLRSPVRWCGSESFCRGP